MCRNVQEDDPSFPTSGGSSLTYVLEPGIKSCVVGAIVEVSIAGSVWSSSPFFSKVLVRYLKLRERVQGRQL